MPRAGARVRCTRRQSCSPPHRRSQSAAGATRGAPFRRTPAPVSHSTPCSRAICSTKVGTPSERVGPGSAFLTVTPVPAVVSALRRAMASCAVSVMPTGNVTPGSFPDPPEWARRSRARLTGRPFLIAFRTEDESAAERGARSISARMLVT